MTIDLNSWEAKIVLEALRTLDMQWNAMIDGTDDEDIQSEYGTDLGQLEIVRERLNTVACEAFGPDVSTFSRREIGVTPAL